MQPQLNADPNAQVNVQQTAFSLDVLGRWVCSSWPEVSGNGGDPFDVVVDRRGDVRRIHCGQGVPPRRQPGFSDSYCRGWLVSPSHARPELPRMGINAPGMQVVAADAQDPGPQNLVWGHPWHSNQAFPGLVNFDFSLFKNNYIKRISDRFNAQFRAEFFNVLNHANFAPPLDNRNIFNATGSRVDSAGLITSTQTPSRQIQFALKLIW